MVWPAWKADGGISPGASAALTARAARGAASGGAASAAGTGGSSPSDRRSFSIRCAASHARCRHSAAFGWSASCAGNQREAAAGGDEVRVLRDRQFEGFGGALIPAQSGQRRAEQEVSLRVVVEEPDAVEGFLGGRGKAAARQQAVAQDHVGRGVVRIQVERLAAASLDLRPVLHPPIRGGKLQVQVRPARIKLLRAFQVLQGPLFVAFGEEQRTHQVLDGVRVPRGLRFADREALPAPLR